MNVALCIFNRPDFTAKVFQAIRNARPSRLFIIADGPRHAEDQEACRLARDAVDHIDWPCDVFRNYSDLNLGCGRRMPSGLDWVFQQVDDAIILEDDCLPHPDFFPFCEQLLDQYRNDTRVAHISGTNFIGALPGDDDSYSFSIYSSNWGWATWRRAWMYFDYRMLRWPAIGTTGWHRNAFRTSAEARYFSELWDAIYSGRMSDVWDGQWQFACMVNHMLSIRPRANLVSNIGFGAGVESTHTGFDHPVAEFPVSPIGFPLRHPELMLVNVEADACLAKMFFRPPLPGVRLAQRTLLNRYWYGLLLRRIPFLGNVWISLRNRLNSKGAE